MALLSPFGFVLPLGICSLLFPVRYSDEQLLTAAGTAVLFGLLLSLVQADNLRRKGSEPKTLAEILGTKK